MGTPYFYRPAQGYTLVLFIIAIGTMGPHSIKEYKCSHKTTTYQQQHENKSQKLQNVKISKDKDNHEYKQNKEQTHSYHNNLNGP